MQGWETIDLDVLKQLQQETFSDRVLLETVPHLYLLHQSWHFAFIPTRVGFLVLLDIECLHKLFFVLGMKNWTTL